MEASASTLPLTTAGNSAHQNVQNEIRQLVYSGRLSEARWVALQHLDHFDRKVLSKAYIESFDDAVKFHGSKGYLDKVQGALREESTMKRVVAKRDTSGCMPAVALGSADPTKEWDECCSILPQEQHHQRQNGQREISWDNNTLDRESSDASLGCMVSNPCCEFSVGSSAHLRLPSLHEPALRIRIGDASKQLARSSTVLELEQDGYLRLFDVAGILWPTGYLLSQCLADPSSCGIGDLLDQATAGVSSKPFAIELGTGVGAPSISLALHLQKQNTQGHDSPPAVLVVATDVAPHALALSTANAWFNEVTTLTFDVMNHFNTASVEEIRDRYFPRDTTSGQHGGFPVVIGSSLQSFFSNSSDPNSAVWKTLEILLDGDNPHALAIFVHVRDEPLVPPSDGSFELVRQISGDKFGMQTRARDSSDFGIFVFRRVAMGVEKPLAIEEEL